MLRNETIELANLVFSDRIKSSKLDEIVMACPLCNEGKSLGKKWRCHIYKVGNNDVVHCFNCGYHKSFYNFIKEYYPNYLDMLKSDFIRKKEKCKNQKNILKIENKKNNDNVILLDDINESKEALEYLEKRGLLEYKDLFKYSKLPQKIKGKIYNFNNHIVAPLKNFDGSLIGYQFISIKKKSYITILLDKNYNKVYNANNVNKDNSLYIYESIFDMLSGIKLGISKMNNSITFLSIYLPKEFINKNNYIITDNYYIDNESYKFIKKHYKESNFFIWGKRFKDSNIKDVNDILKANINIINKEFKTGVTLLATIFKNLR